MLRQSHFFTITDANITTTIDTNMTVTKQDDHLKLRNKLLLLGLQLMQLPAGLGRLPGLQQLGLLKDVQLQLLMSHILPFYTFRNDREIRSSVIIAIIHHTLKCWIPCQLLSCLCICICLSRKCLIPFEVITRLEDVPTHFFRLTRIIRATLSDAIITSLFLFLTCMRLDHQPHAAPVSFKSSSSTFALSSSIISPNKNIHSSSEEPTCISCGTSLRAPSAESANILFCS